MKIRTTIGFFAVICILICGTLFTSCKGPEGEAYLAYSWVSAPLYLYDENPSIPSTVHNGTYYKTNEGSYYMEYIAWDDSAWWMTYKISANPGQPFFQEGEPAYFEISLYSFGPSIYQWDEPRSADNSMDDDTGSDPSAAPAGSSEPIPPADRGDSGTESIVRGGYTLEIEWGKLE